MEKKDVSYLLLIYSGYSLAPPLSSDTESINSDHHLRCGVGG